MSPLAAGGKFHILVLSGAEGIVPVKMLDDTAVEEFRSIYEKELHETLTPGQARLIATLLLRLYRTLSQPLPSDRGHALARSRQLATLKERDAPRNPLIPS